MPKILSSYFIKWGYMVLSVFLFTCTLCFWCLVFKIIFISYCVRSSVHRMLHFKYSSKLIGLYEYFWLWKVKKLTVIMDVYYVSHLYLKMFCLWVNNVKSKWLLWREKRDIPNWSCAIWKLQIVRWIKTTDVCRLRFSLSVWIAIRLSLFYMCICILFPLVCKEVFV
jgi:hypothetical protein